MIPALAGIYRLRPSWNGIRKWAKNGCPARRNCGRFLATPSPGQITVAGRPLRRRFHA